MVIASLRPVEKEQSNQTTKAFTSRRSWGSERSRVETAKKLRGRSHQVAVDQLHLRLDEHGRSQAAEVEPIDIVPKSQ
eukprot:6920461-Prorocentrum_lima.AAC.1